MIYSAGLWPFDIYRYFSSTKLNWLEHENGIEIRPNAFFSSPVPPIRLFQSFYETDQLSLEVYLLTKDNRQKGPARIVSYSADTGKRDFTLGQEKNSLIFRLRTTGTDANGINPSFKAHNIFTASEKQHVVFTYDGNSENLFINGQLIQSTSEVKGDFSNWNKEHYLVFGNEVTADRPWNGRLYLVAIYNKSINKGDVERLYRNTAWAKDVGMAGMRENLGLVSLYTLDEGQGKVAYDTSRFGKTGKLLAKRIPKNELRFGSIVDPHTGRVDYMDVLINVLGFVPLSFIVCFLIDLNRKSVWNVFILPLILGGFLSFSVEYLQQFTMLRHPNVVDIIFNIVGVVVGSSLLYLYLVRRKAKSVNII